MPSTVIICMIERVAAPMARITPISRVRSMTLMLMVPINPRPPTNAISKVITINRLTRMPN